MDVLFISRCAADERQKQPLLGFSALGSYGLVLNQSPLDFSKLLGVYVALFALVSVLFGKCLFHELIASSTWLGLCVVLLGSALIQWGCAQAAGQGRPTPR